ncbi:MAG: PLD nuclease N-terminal domain-containing protein [Campylobacterota bacterium]|nr:PLD nuclease N-terminal domain-containing protein [Campylobacterota bacterium]
MIDSVSSMGTLGMVLMFGLFIFWGWALIDILKSDFKDGINKLIWLLVVFFFYGLGALLYLFIGRNQKKS